MTLPITTRDVCIGRDVVEYDVNWKQTKQPNWFDKICEKLKSMLKNKNDNTREHCNIDRV